MSELPVSDWLRVEAAAEFLNVSTSMLAKMRLRGDGPRYAKMGSKLVLYSKSDIEQYLAERLRNSTSEIGS